MVDKHIIDKTTGETLKVEDARESIANYVLPAHPTERKHGVQIVDSVDVAEANPYLPDEYTDVLLGGVQGRPDPVRHPPHYTSGKIEVWDFIVDQGLDFLRGNVVKYVCRAGEKTNEIEDLKKARAYIDRAIRELEEA